MHRDIIEGRNQKDGLLAAFNSMNCFIQAMASASGSRFEPRWIVDRARVGRVSINPNLLVQLIRCLPPFGGAHFGLWIAGV
jgi:hypothetical protein